MKFRALQWNIQAARTLDAGKDPKKSASYSGDNPEYFAEIIKSYNPDFVTFQELHENAKRSQLEEIAKLAGLEYFASDVYDEKSFMDSSYGMSQGIASKHELLNHEYYNVNYRKFEDTDIDGVTYIARDFGVTMTEFAIGKSSLTIATTHLIPFGAFKIDPNGEEAKPLRESLDKTTLSLGEKWLLMGDFNVQESSLKKFIPKTMKLVGVEEITQSTPTVPKGLSLDHVLYRSIKLIDSKVDSSVLADHYLLISDFEI